MSEDEINELRKLSNTGGYPTRTAQLSKLSLGQLTYLRQRANMDRGRAIGHDPSYARAMKQLANRIRDIINAKTENVIAAFCDPFGIFKPMSDSERAGVSMELLERNEMREEMAA